MACVQTSPCNQKKSGTGEGDICTQATGSKGKGESQGHDQMLREGMNINLNFSEGLEGRVHSVQEELVIIFFEEIYLALSPITCSMQVLMYTYSTTGNSIWFSHVVQMWLHVI